METNNTNMKDIGEGTIRRIDWTELTPVVLLLRVFNVSLDMRLLAFALCGWWLTKGINSFSGILTSEQAGDAASGAMFRVNVPFDTFYAAYIETSLAVQQHWAGILWLLYVAAIWIFFGGMICRIVAVRLTVDESESNRNLLHFFRKRGISFASSLIILSLGIFCCYLPVKIAGWLAAIPVVKYIIVVLFPIPIVFALWMVILAFGLAVGWMLLFAAVSADGSDGFDAISRMFSYIFQRPLHYILYWFICGLLGWLGFALVQFVIHAAVFVCWNVLPEDFVGTFWLTGMESIPIAYLFAWFWTSSVAIYLLLRRSVDATPFDEVYRVTPPVVRSLPPIKKDEHGAPEIVPPEQSAS